MQDNHEEGTVVFPSTPIFMNVGNQSSSVNCETVAKCMKSQTKSLCLCLSLSHTHTHTSSTTTTTNNKNLMLNKLYFFVTTSHFHTFTNNPKTTTKTLVEYSCWVLLPWMYRLCWNYFKTASGAQGLPVHGHILSLAQGTPDTVQ